MRNNDITADTLIQNIKCLIDKTRYIVAQVINSEMTMLYWYIGQKINKEVLKNERAEYGQEIIKSLAIQLSAEYGRGFTYTALTRMIKFYESFTEQQIVATLSQQLSWSHILELLPLKNMSQRTFYTYMAIHDNWSVRQLRSNIHKLLYERSEFSKKLVLQSQQNLLLLKLNQELSPDMILKDTYILEFLNLPEEHYENDLEQAILQKIEQFILELDSRFSFVARQKRMTIDNEHFYLDLLFYNRKTRRLVAVELKSGRFKAEYKGQMELYLNWLKKYECFTGENAPIGIILCSEKSKTQIELLDVSTSGIHVAEYWTELPPIDIFEKRIQEIVLQTKKHYDKDTVLLDTKGGYT
ncbi:MAG: PDDEXK nuclease domain-containing protein [Rickettsia endosymbiont of Pseudomimeciton antennatum]|nr:PDDEXK nuclease domain-containing protein [Rickettsia endosymbiont of Pseudomimeciton antennatum]